MTVTANLLTASNAVANLRGSGNTTGTGATTIIAAQGASTKINVKGVQCKNSGATSTVVTLNDSCFDRAFGPRARRRQRSVRSAPKRRGEHRPDLHARRWFDHDLLQRAGLFGFVTMRLIFALILAILGLRRQRRGARYGCAGCDGLLLHLRAERRGQLQLSPGPVHGFLLPRWAVARPAAGFAPGGFVATVTGNDVSQYGANRLPISVPGIDDCVGNYTPVAKLLDPDPSTCGGAGQAACLSIPGCVYSTSTSGTGEGQLKCGGATFTGAVQHINLGPVDGHGCTNLYVNEGSVSAVYLIDDFWGFNNSGKCGTSAGLPWIDLCALWEQPSPSRMGSLTAMGSPIERQGVPGCTICSPAIAATFSGPTATGSATFKNAVFAHFAGRTIYSGSGTGFNATISTTSSSMDGIVRRSTAIRSGG